MTHLLAFALIAAALGITYARMHTKDTALLVCMLAAAMVALSLEWTLAHLWPALAL